jgi:hypothetical protein
MAFLSSASVGVVSLVGCMSGWMDGLQRTKLCVRVGGLFVNGVLDGLVVGLHGDFVLAGAALVVVVLDFAGGDVLGAHVCCGWRLVVKKGLFGVGFVDGVGSS